MLEPNHPIIELLRRDRRYRLDAYVFVFEALRYAQQELGMGQAGERDPSQLAESGAAGADEENGGEIRHVTGQQLCQAIRRYALQQYGPLAKNVLEHWGVRSTGDFGEIVFNLIDVGQMKKTDSDRREDFDDVFDFDEGLRETFEPVTPAGRKEQRQ
jgi:uncharacterized repeat protein (TIGR04138 family)